MKQAGIYISMISFVALSRKMKRAIIYIKILRTYSLDYQPIVKYHIEVRNMCVKLRELLNSET